MQSLQRIEEWALWFCIATLPLTRLPHKLALPLLGGNLPMIFILLAIMALGIEVIRYHSVDFPFKIFWVVYVGWSIVSILVGSIQFPYYNELPADILDGSSLGRIIIYLVGNADVETYIPLGLVITFLGREIKELLLPLGVFLLIYHLYSKNWQEGFNHILKGVRAVAILCCVYSCIEIFWLWTGNPGCEALLKHINVWLYDPVQDHGWWPPLLWHGQARSVFLEPSFLGIAEAFMIPFFWYLSMVKRRKIDIGITLFLLLMLFMTNARTALVIYIGELLILSLLGVFVCYPQWKKYTLTILLMSCVMLGVNLLGNNTVRPVYDWAVQQLGYFVSSDMKKQEMENLSAFSYIKDNVISVVGRNNRSNTARYGNTVAMLNVGVEHPLFGVGYGYESNYMKYKFPSWAQTHPEVKNWTYLLDKLGPLKSGYPLLNQYAATFMRSGFIGVILFLIAPVYVLYRLYRRRSLLQDFRIICLLVIIAGQMACMMSNTVFITYFISLSLLTCVVLSRENTNENN